MFIFTHSSRDKPANMPTASASYADSKKHFLILDALRGIAAIMVVLMHVFEVFCGGDYIQLIINHGYLAVDFFFMLSGYVMAHAYDDRWDTMTTGQFFKRRLIRLHPLIILGMVFGAAMFFFQESPFSPKIADTSVVQLLLIFFIGLTLLPVTPAMDIRGWNEMHPLNGPAWSLFFEYLANIFHALFLRKLSNGVLFFFVFLAGVGLTYVLLTKPSGDIIGGWSLDPEQLKIGFARLLFPYMAGMLLRRVVAVKSGRNTLLLTAFILVLVLSMPRIGGYDHLTANALYELVVIILVFPGLIYLGATGDVTNKAMQKVCIFLGDISYPLYITHFPFVCIYYAWVTNNTISLGTGTITGLAFLLFSVLLAYAALKLYDEPVRRWLKKSTRMG